MGTPDMIGIDWGTSSFRAFLMGSNGQEFDQFSSADGLLAVRDRAFGAVLQKTCGAWLAHWPDLKVIMCGMVGSQSGWRDAGYLDGNARVQDLAAALVPVQTDTHGVDIRLVPGIKGPGFRRSPRRYAWRRDNPHGCIIARDAGHICSLPAWNAYQMGHGAGGKHIQICDLYDR